MGSGSHRRGAFPDRFVRHIRLNSQCADADVMCRISRQNYQALATTQGHADLPGASRRCTWLDTNA
jgi:hypothetical protein